LCVCFCFVFGGGGGGGGGGGREGGRARACDFIRNKTSKDKNSVTSSLIQLEEAECFAETIVAVNKLRDGLSKQTSSLSALSSVSGLCRHKCRVFIQMHSFHPNAESWRLDL
jgi:hypothetical protein